MLDVIHSLAGRCERCGGETEVARVTFWDDSFRGLICWEDLAARVRAKSEGPNASQPLARARQEGHGTTAGPDAAEGRDGTGPPVRPRLSPGPSPGTTDDGSAQQYLTHGATKGGTDPRDTGGEG